MVLKGSQRGGAKQLGLHLLKTEENEQVIRDPSSGKRISRINPEEEWIRKDVPELRIVDDELWEKVKSRQRALPTEREKFWKAKRPKYLLSGLLKCGCCGGGFSMANHNRYGCSTRRNKGTCHNGLKIGREALEQMVVSALQTHLMDEELCKVFCDEYARHANKLRMDKNARINALQSELSRLESGRQRLIEAIKSGVPGEDVKGEMIAIGDRRREIEYTLSGIDEAPVLIHPSMSLQYQAEIGRLIETLNGEEPRAEASELMRSLIDKIVLTPNSAGTELTIDLFGDLAGVLAMARKGEKPLDTSDIETMGLKLVAEEGLEPPTRGL